MKIGILQTGHSPEALTDDFGSYPDMFMQLLGNQGLTFQTFAVVDGEFPENAQSADGWLITGSRFGAYEDHDWIPPLERLILDAYGQSIPIVGICFGHQILAQALGGVVEKFDQGWSVGATDYVVDGSDTPVTIMAWHQDQVTVRPKDAKVIGSSPFCENAMLVYGTKALGIQAHPEFGESFTRGLFEKRGPGVVPEHLLTAAAKNLGAPLSTTKIAAQIGEFFKRVSVANL